MRGKRSGGYAALDGGERTKYSILMVFAWLLRGLVLLIVSWYGRMLVWLCESLLFVVVGRGKVGVMNDFNIYSKHDGKYSTVCLWGKYE